MDPIVEKLLSARKGERRQLIRQELNELATRGDLDRMRSILESVVQLRPKWEHGLTSILRDMIKNDSTTVLAQNSLIFLLKFLGKWVELVLCEKDTGVDIPDLGRLMMRLERIPLIPNLVLNVKYETQSPNVYDLCAIAAWAAPNAQSLVFSGRHRGVGFFLERAGIFEAFNDPSSDPVKFDTETILGFTRIDPEKRFETDAHAGRLVALFRKNMELSVPAAQGLSISFAELIENAIKHGEITSPAFLFANYHPQPRIMHVCICDRGLGVRKTFEKSSSPRLRELALESTGWIREATEPLVTSKTEGHAGYGLYLARELCRRNGGTFAIVSGNAAFTIHPRTADSAISDVEELRELDVPPYRGIASRAAA